MVFALCFLLGAKLFTSQCVRTHLGPLSVDSLVEFLPLEIVEVLEQLLPLRCFKPLGFEALQYSRFHELILAIFKLHVLRKT